MTHIHQSPPRCVACGQLHGDPHAVGCSLARYTICGFCADYTKKGAEPQYTELGLGRCYGHGQNPPARYVAWNATCGSFRSSANAASAR